MLTFRAFFDAFGNLDWLAALVGMIAAMVLGSLWYGPVFGKPWARAQGVAVQGSGAMAKEMVMTAAYSLLFNIGLQFLAYVHDGMSFDVEHAVVAGLILALFVSGPALFSGVVWARRKPLVFAIDAGFWFAAGAVCVMAQGLVA
ncbi:MAG: DUF1761 domain-containing protein [Actinobacteria bacterium]|nr:DUF1761 domain-containing protein [Actinomycetota bacterium]